MSYIAVAKQYAKDVVSGKRPACLFVKQACERFQKDLKRKDITLNYKKPGQEYIEADRWCMFLETLPHVKGAWASRHELFVLSDWQIFCNVNIFGWYNKETKRRRFREAYIEVPRKNGKTFWIAGVGVGMLTIDDEFGAEVYCGATSEDQANEVFRPARQICERNHQLRNSFGIEVNKKSLNIIPLGNRFQPVIGNPGDGASPSCGIADEFHEHRTSDLVDTFVTGMGAREQPLMLYITTAGSDMGGPCYAKRDDIKQVLNGTVEDDQVFGIIYTLDDDDQWDTVEAQVKANPNYDISVNAEFLQGQLAQARRSSTSQSAYKTKHLNIWVGAQSPWMNMLAYQACRKKDLTLEQFKGQECFVAIDLASKVDIASMAILFPPYGSQTQYTAFCKHYLPEETILNTNRYIAWHSDGWLESTPGNVTDFGYIEDDLLELSKNYQVIEIPYDPFQATQFSQRMMEHRLPMVEVGATVRNFSEPMKQLEALILEKKIQFTNDPVLNWCFGNVVAKLDKKDNIYPNKERYENKIDPVVALIMAVNRLMVYEPPAPSIYEFGPL